MRQQPIQQQQQQQQQLNAPWVHWKGSSSPHIFPSFCGPRFNWFSFEHFLFTFDFI